MVTKCVEDWCQGSSKRFDSSSTSLTAFRALTFTGRDLFLNSSRVSFKRLSCPAFLKINTQLGHAAGSLWNLTLFFCCAKMLWEVPISQHWKLLTDMAHLTPRALTSHVLVIVWQRGSNTSLSWPWRHWWPFCPCPRSPVASLHPSPWPRRSVSAGALGPCPRGIVGVPVSSPASGLVSCVDSCCHLISGPICCSFCLGSLDTLGSGFSLASYGAVSSPS